MGRAACSPSPPRRLVRFASLSTPRDSGTAPPQITAAIWRSEDVFVRTSPGLYTVDYERAIIKVVVLGSGSFGTAVGTLLARNGHEVRVPAALPPFSNPFLFLFLPFNCPL